MSRADLTTARCRGFHEGPDKSSSFCHYEPQDSGLGSTLPDSPLPALLITSANPNLHSLPLTHHLVFPDSTSASLTQQRIKLLPTTPHPHFCRTSRLECSGAGHLGRFWLIGARLSAILYHNSSSQAISVDPQVIPCRAPTFLAFPSAPVVKPFPAVLMGFLPPPAIQPRTRLASESQTGDAEPAQQGATCAIK
jgi:hypothetical protein